MDNTKKYLENSNITIYIEEMMSGIMKDKPEEPLLYMMQYIRRKASQKGIQISHDMEPLDLDISNNALRNSGAISRLSTSKSYEKPWLSGTTKKTFTDHYKDRNTNNTNENIVSNTPISSNIDNEFKLVVEVQRNSLHNQELFSPKNSNTKENILNSINQERQAKIDERLLLEAKLREKEDSNQEYDSAIELAEDPGLYSNEFQINPSNESLTKCQRDILIMKQNNTFANLNGNTCVKFGICSICSRFYESDVDEIQRSLSQRELIVTQGSLIMDDLESASQVNGPRMIDSEMESNKIRTKYSKKKISVSDFEITSKAWPVIDATSESSNNRATSKSKISSRNIR